MVTAFNTNVASALNRVAPVKSFKIRSNHRFGLSEGVKSLMKKTGLDQVPNRQILHTREEGTTTTVQSA